jgi:hypothetical protein
VSALVRREVASRRSLLSKCSAITVSIGDDHGGPGRARRGGRPPFRDACPSGCALQLETKAGAQMKKLGRLVGNQAR